MHYAAEENLTEVCELLISKGANIEIADIFNQNITIIFSLI